MSALKVGFLKEILSNLKGFRFMNQFNQRADAILSIATQRVI